MSQESVNQKLLELNSNKDIKSVKPIIPVAILLQEAENLYDWCTKDKEELIRISLDWKLVEDLPVKAAALRKSQSR